VNAIRQAVLARRLRAARLGYKGDLRLRLHQPGDAANTIDWYASARRGELCVRERARDTTVTWAAIVDESASMCVPVHDPPLAAAREAGAVWRDCLGAGDAWLRIDGGAPFSLEAALQAALRELPACCALLCVSDFYGRPESGRSLMAITARRFDCTALVTRDRWEPPNGFVRVVDAESAAARSVCLNRGELARYTTAARERERDVCALFRECGWRAAVLERDAGDALRRAFDLP
jgi:uncharacterized protein (DUF58 family)